MKNIAIIPARSGSKGLKDKNIKNMAGLPLMVYSIIAAAESEMFDIIHVSTDSKDYADIARKYGAHVPFLRDEQLSGDSVSTWDAAMSVIDKYEERGMKFDTMTILQPTSPLRSKADIVQAFELYKNKKANAIVGVCEMEHSPLWSNTIDESLDMTGFLREELVMSPRQKLSQYYRINGAVYITDIAYYRKYNNIYKEKCYAYIMPKERSVDIDDKYDFVIAETLMLNKNLTNSN